MEHFRLHALKIDAEAEAEEEVAGSPGSPATPGSPEDEASFDERTRGELHRVLGLWCEEVKEDNVARSFARKMSRRKKKGRGGRRMSKEAVGSPSSGPPSP